LETYGTGNLPNFPWLISLLERKIQEGLIIVNVTQCTAGKVMQERYENGNDLQEIGVLSGKDLTTAAAITKLMFLLGTYPDQTNYIRNLFNISLVGEQTDW
jgi:L-asparaginase